MPSLIILPFLNLFPVTSCDDMLYCFVLCDLAYITFNSNSVKRKKRGRRREMCDPMSKIESFVDESEHNMED